MTQILRTKRFEKDLDRVPDFIRVKAIFWIKQVKDIGLQEVRKRSGYHDEPLHGLRKGQRSVRLNHAYRMIYRETNEHLEILLLEVIKHAY